MSAAMTSSTDDVIVHVRLLDEGVEVWRPVEASRVSGSTFRLSGKPTPEDEQWSFQPGEIVVAEARRGETSGPEKLVAIARAHDFDEPSQRLRALAG